MLTELILTNIKIVKFIEYLFYHILCGMKSYGTVHCIEGFIELHYLYLPPKFNVITCL